MSIIIFCIALFSLCFGILIGYCHGLRSGAKNAHLFLSSLYGMVIARLGVDPADAQEVLDAISMDEIKLQCRKNLSVFEGKMKRNSSDAQTTSYD